MYSYHCIPCTVKDSVGMEYLPDRNSRYKDVDYWDERYKTEKSFEWFGDFSKFQHLLQRHVMKDDAILVLGMCSDLTCLLVFISEEILDIVKITFVKTLLHQWNVCLII